MSNEDLLQELKELGYNATTGRKQRSDKGQSRGPISRDRSDKGQRREGKQKSIVSIYLSLRNKLLNRHTDKEQEEVRQDINGIYLLISTDNKQVHKYHQVVNHGSIIHRTVKHIQGNTIDLEQYRFKALQDIASPSKDLDQYTIKVFGNELRDTHSDNTYDLFCRLYHIKDEDLIMWTYDKWREHYAIVCDNLLSEDFRFDLTHKPGSVEFCPEYAETYIAKEELTTAALEQSKEYINQRARFYDEEYSREFNRMRQYILKDQCELSMTQVEKLARQMINMSLINNKVKERLAQWIAQKKGESNE